MKTITKIVPLMLMLILCSQFQGVCNDFEKEDQQFKVTIIYDNYDFKEGLKTGWGFSCLLEVNDQTILFDTGNKSRVFKHNFEALRIDPEKVDAVVISHDHFDHTGGLETFLAMKHGIPVFITESSSIKTKEIIQEAGSTIQFTPQISEISKDVYLCGTLGYQIEEQSLAIRTDKGLVIITGCSHPGINKVLKHFKEGLQEEIFMVFGGFHLMRMNEDEMNTLISEMKEIGVQKCGATHCTGNKQIEMFRNAFGENYVTMGVGNVIEF